MDGELGVVSVPHEGHHLGVALAETVDQKLVACDARGGISWIERSECHARMSPVAVSCLTPHLRRRDRLERARFEGPSAPSSPAHQAEL